MKNRTLGGVFALVLVASAISAPLATAHNGHGNSDKAHGKSEEKRAEKAQKGLEKANKHSVEHKQDNKVAHTQPEKKEQRHTEGRGNANESKKGNHVPVTICHKTGSKNNPYVIITVDDDSITKGGHGHHHDHGDIIPPFIDDEGKQYPGQNWTSEGYAACKKKHPVKEAEKVAPKEDKAPEKDQTPAPVTVPENTTPTKPTTPATPAAPVTTPEAKVLPESLPTTGSVSAGVTALVAMLLTSATVAASYAIRTKLTQQSEM